MSRIIAALLAVASCAAIAQAQTAPSEQDGPVLTLDQALASAGATSPSADVGQTGIRAADAGRTVAGLRPNPSVNIQTENVAGTGPYRGLDSSETTIGFELPIELGRKRSARVAVADARVIRARIEALVVLEDLRLRVTQAYIEAVAAERRLAIAIEQARIADELLRVAKDRVMVGAASPIEEQRAAVLQANAQGELARARRTVEVSRANLGRLIGTPVSGPLDMAWFDRVAAYGPVAPIRVEGTLAYAAANADLAIGNAQVRLARTQRMPDLTLTAGTRRLEATNDVAAVFGVSVPLPLFNSGRAGEAQARAERDQFEARTRLAKADAEQAIASAQADLANALAMVETTRGPALDAAIEGARIARVGYGEGALTQIELLDAERTLAQTRAAAIDALVAYHDAAARLRRLAAPAPDFSGEF